jgi:trehalose 6-phosphate synthase/phosphatase
VRLLIVSNRLPITLSEEEGQITLGKSAGGLVSGLSDYLESLESSSFTQAAHLWVGWPGAAISENIQNEVQQRCLSEFSAYPVFIPEEEMDNFYNGFCNKTIWPLFHCFPSHAVYEERFWDCYQRVNEIFCDTIVQILKPDDVVWIQDYHLMLVPRLVRKKLPDTPIGFFLHIPFPPYEMFQLLPKLWRREILEGLLGADLVGFHTVEYTQGFLKCVLRILGYEHNIGEINTGGHVVKADTLPMGIHFKKYHEAADDMKVQQEIAALRQNFQDTKVILSVDRLDYTKGVINRLLGFEAFLEKNPGWHKKVTLLLILVPSRIGIASYQKAKRDIDEHIGKINGKFGCIGWVPIQYQYKYLPFEQLVSLYNICDIALITPLRDGMNLVAKEYIAARWDKTGVLILSEMTGASKELGEAVIVNPNHKEEIAASLKDALEMPVEEQISRNDIMQNRLADYDVIRWADNFIQELSELNIQRKKFNAKLLFGTEKER